MNYNMLMNLFSIFDPSGTLMSKEFMFLSWWWFFIPSIFLSKSTLLILLKEGFNNLSKELSALYSSKYIFSIPVFLTLFIMIFSLNYLSMLPYVFNLTSQVSFTFSLTVFIWTGLLIKKGLSLKNLLAHMVPVGTPVFLLIFMVLIESVSLIIQPLTLSIRLMANMTAGHLVLSLLSSGMMNSFSIGFLLFFTQFALLTLEFLVALIQAYVFSVLLTLYSMES